MLDRMQQHQGDGKQDAKHYCGWRGHKAKGSHFRNHRMADIGNVEGKF